MAYGLWSRGLDISIFIHQIARQIYSQRMVSTIRVTNSQEYDTIRQYLTDGSLPSFKDSKEKQTFMRKVSDLKLIGDGMYHISAKGEKLVVHHGDAEKIDEILRSVHLPGHIGMFSTLFYLRFNQNAP